MEIILADDASSNKTIEKVKYYRQKNPEMNIKIMRQNSHAGKAMAINKALKDFTKPIIIVSDARVY